MNARSFPKLSVERLMILFVMMAALVLQPLAAHAAASRGEVTAVIGHGSGMMIIAPTARADGYFEAEMTLVIRGASAYTTFEVFRAPDFNPDGVCTGQGWRQFKHPPETAPDAQPVYLTTSAGGAGAAHWKYEAPLFPSGLVFDVWVQAIGDDGSVLQSECMTIHVK